MRNVRTSRMVLCAAAFLTACHGESYSKLQSSERDLDLSGGSGTDGEVARREATYGGANSWLGTLASRGGANLLGATPVSGLGSVGLGGAIASTTEADGRIRTLDPPNISSASGGMGGSMAPSGSTQCAERSSSGACQLPTGGRTTTASHAVGGLDVTGETSSAGGKSTTGGLPATGGNAQVGGMLPAAGRATGGANTTGGMLPTGGRATGGIISTGGMLPTGGRATGGIAATGGMLPTGGRATGGITATGGMLPTGGRATGGVPTTGGGTGTGGFPQTSWCIGRAAWQGCGGPAGDVCEERIAAYPYYTKHYPGCSVSRNCAGSYESCTSSCPEPQLADMIDYQSYTCAGISGGWDGCRGSGCTACVELLVDYPKYFDRHPDCKPNCTCGNGGFFATTCSATCPAPAAEDQ